MNKQLMKNLYEGLKAEEKESTANYNNEARIEEFLRHRVSNKNIIQVREGISLAPEDVLFVKDIKVNILREDPTLSPNKSQIYRMGLHLLKTKSNQELLELYKYLFNSGYN